ncbi:MAG: zinc-ribbon domain-containing protein [Chloroflexi bacterium]|nr:zinc-ribbon domain-containing protein [Chloroflexota bacterium]
MSSSPCPVCQTLHPPGAKFCPNCGHAFESEGAPAADAQPDPLRRFVPPALAREDSGRLRRRPAGKHPGQRRTARRAGQAFGVVTRRIVSLNWARLPQSSPRDVINVPSAYDLQHSARIGPSVKIWAMSRHYLKEVPNGSTLNDGQG